MYDVTKRDKVIHMWNITLSSSFAQRSVRQAFIEGRERWPHVST